MICLHFFDGKGYDKIFVEQLNNIVDRTRTESIEVTEGTDELCLACTYQRENTCRYNETAEKEIRDMDQTALHLLGLKRDSEVSWDEIREEIPGIFPHWFKSYCSDCDWNAACSKGRLFQ